MAADVGGGDGKKRPRIDMTPMVDLGFLLLTFFVLTTSMDNPKAMQVTIPAPLDEAAEPPPPVPAERVLTFICTGEDRIYWYTGKSDGEAFELNMFTNYGEGVIRNLVRKRQAEVLREPKLQRFTDKSLIVLLKISEDATYQNMVDMFDEMQISRQMGRTMLMNVSPDELALIKDYEQSKSLSSSIAKSIEIIGLPRD
jgi:biopolymer transport protein ExbD